MARAAKTGGAGSRAGRSGGAAAASASAARRTAARGGAGPARSRASIALPARELVVVANPEVRLRARRGAVASLAGIDVADLAGLARSEGVSMRPLFGASEERLEAACADCRRRGGARAGAPEAVPDLSLYYRVEAPDARLEELAERLRESAAIRAAYIKPPPELPARLNDMAPRIDEPPVATPDFTGRQGYLAPAPSGIDARYAWTRAGGAGAGVGIIDIEGAWRFSHEDLAHNQGGVVGGLQSTDPVWRNHGTAVVGVIGGDRTAFGVTGICPDAHVRAISVFGSGAGSAVAIRQAAEMLTAGDIILIELHRAGPRFGFALRNDQRGYIPIEWWPDDYDAIRYAVALGVIVVEAGGNGGEELDDPLYDAPDLGFPPDWSNPFRRGARDCGAIVVGAGAPPPGTHGRDHGPDRSRLEFSNWGTLIDVQGWGREVTTTGYGDLQGGSSEDVWYSDRFSGTSSASPVVVGALACVQGALRAAGKSPLTPTGARALLRGVGSPQQDAPGRPAAERIGSRPDLRRIIDGFFAPQSVPLYRYWNDAIGDHFYTCEWSELGTGRFGYAYEGICCHVLAQPVAGSVPLHRYWNPTLGDHLYTTDPAQVAAGGAGWEHEGIACHVYAASAPGTIPLYRYANAAIGDHFYTVEWAELGTGRYGFAYEGIQCHVLPLPAVGGPGVPDSTGAVQGGGSAESIAVAAAQPMPESAAAIGQGEIGEAEASAAVDEARSFTLRSATLPEAAERERSARSFTLRGQSAGRGSAGARSADVAGATARESAAPVVCVVPASARPDGAGQSVVQVNVVIEPGRGLER